ncbi:hypothetical protein [Wielerella bovis]|uniref:hypothetical protein n=1 Tax=Wielerella bovis TaxID=2917790 RepID=UPI0020186F67|nr:hypothetical protein [Wielerella bovis]ULJ65915.1 hypothetical protein MIS31_06435 [Wielerella bovis]
MQPERICLNCLYADPPSAARYYGHKTPHIHCKVATGVDKASSFIMTHACVNGKFELLNDDEQIKRRVQYLAQWNIQI